MANVTLVYGTYSFSPIPTLGLSREYKKAEDGRIISAVTRISLEGTLTPFPGNLGGIYNVTVLKDALVTAFNTQGCQLLLRCDGNTLLDCYPRINNVVFRNSPNNWVNSVGYTIDLEKDDELPTSEITNLSNVDNVADEWSIESLEDKSAYSFSTDTRASTYKLNHNLSAKGYARYSGCSPLSKEPWEYARDFCSGRMGYPSTDMLGIPSASYTPFNHHRVQTINKEAGRYNIVENWTLLSSGGISGNALEDFTVDIRQSADSDITTVGIQGSIQGLETVSYTGMNIINSAVDVPKYTNALAFWDNIQGSLLTRAQLAYSNGLTPAPTRGLNPLKISKTIGQNIPNGLINYSYEYSNKPTYCVTSAIAENIQFSYDFPSDVFASITILGRTSGPLIQLMGTRTPYTLTATIDVVVPIVTGCIWEKWALANSPHSQIKDMLTLVETELGSNDTLVKTKDTINWIPTEGKYNRSVSWLYNSCGGAGTSVSDL